MQASYKPRSRQYGVNGLSVLVHANAQQSATYIDLARRNPLPNKLLSISVIGVVRAALKQQGYGMILYITPSPDLPDHHSLVVFRVDPGDPQDNSLSPPLADLPDDAAEALRSVMTTIQPNPYPKQQP